MNVNLAIMQQWIMPTALHSLQPFKDMDWARMVERALMLAVSRLGWWRGPLCLLVERALMLAVSRLGEE